MDLGTKSFQPNALIQIAVLIKERGEIGNVTIVGHGMMIIEVVVRDAERNAKAMK